MGAQDMSSPRDKSGGEERPFDAACSIRITKTDIWLWRSLAGKPSGKLAWSASPFATEEVSMATRHLPVPPIPLARGTRNFCLRMGFIFVATWPLLLALVLFRALLLSVF